MTYCALISHKKHMLRTQKVVVFEKSVGAKLVNHTAKQIVPFRAKNYQPLPTIAMIMGGQQIPTIRMPASHAGE